MAYPYDILPGGKGASYPVAPAAPVQPNTFKVPGVTVPVCPSPAPTNDCGE